MKLIKMLFKIRTTSKSFHDAYQQTISLILSFDIYMKRYKEISI